MIKKQKTHENLKGRLEFSNKRSVEKTVQKQFSVGCEAHRGKTQAET